MRFIYTFLLIALLLMAACTSQAIKDNLNAFILKDNLPEGITYQEMNGPDNIPGENNQFFVTADYSNDAILVTVKKFESIDMAKGQVIAKKRWREPEDVVTTVTNAGHTMEIVTGSEGGSCAFYIDEYEFAIGNSGNAYQNSAPVDNDAFDQFCRMMFNNAISILGSFEAPPERDGKTYDGIGDFTVSDNDRVQIDSTYRIEVESNTETSTPDYILYEGNTAVLRSEASNSQRLYSPKDIPYTFLVYRVVGADANLRVYRNIEPTETFSLAEYEGFICGEGYVYFDYQPRSTQTCWIGHYSDPDSSSQLNQPFTSNRQDPEYTFTCETFTVTAISCENQQLLLERSDVPNSQQELSVVDQVVLTSQEQGDLILAFSGNIDPTETLPVVVPVQSAFAATYLTPLETEVGVITYVFSSEEIDTAIEYFEGKQAPAFTGDKRGDLLQYLRKGNVIVEVWADNDIDAPLVIQLADQISERLDMSQLF